MGGTSWRKRGGVGRALGLGLGRSSKRIVAREVWAFVRRLGVEVEEGRSRSLKEEEEEGRGVELPRSVFGLPDLLSATSPSPADLSSLSGIDRWVQYVVEREGLGRIKLMVGEEKKQEGEG